MLFFHGDGMTRERDEILRNTARLKARFGELFDEVEQILFRHDPIGIAFTDHDSVAVNPDEYAPEVETILPRLESARTESDLTDIVYEEFLGWFGDAEIVGPKEQYQAIAADIWATWLRFDATRKS